MNNHAGWGGRIPMALRFATLAQSAQGSREVGGSVHRARNHAGPDSLARGEENADGYVQSVRAGGRPLAMDTRRQGNHARRSIPQRDASLRRGEWAPGMGTELFGKTLGVVGAGSIGIRTLEIGRAFGITT